MKQRVWARDLKRHVSVTQRGDMGDVAQHPLVQWMLNHFEGLSLDGWCFCFEDEGSLDISADSWRHLQIFTAGVVWLNQACMKHNSEQCGGRHAGGGKRSVVSHPISYELLFWVFFPLALIFFPVSFYITSILPWLTLLSGVHFISYLNTLNTVHTYWYWYIHLGE